VKKRIKENKGNSARVAKPDLISLNSNIINRTDLPNTLLQILCSSTTTGLQLQQKH